MYLLLLMSIYFQYILAARCFRIKKGVWENIPNASVEMELLSPKHGQRIIRRRHRRRYGAECFAISYTP